MDPMQIFSVWLTVFSLSFTFLPMFMVLDWKKRGTAEGFSSVNFVLPMLAMSCWFKHGHLTTDKMAMFINGFNLVFFTFYTAAFAYYQPRRKYLYGQVASLLVTLFSIFSFVNKRPLDNQADLMGSIAAATQIASLAGGVYDLKRAARLGTTEYIPASLQFSIFALTVQWSLFGFLVRNYYMMVANLAGLALNLATFAMYLAYPPRTWTVPLLGVGGKGKNE